jgi:PAS domain S-box-containing protein
MSSQDQEQVKTICPYCGVGCGIKVLEGDEAGEMRFMPWADAPVNEGSICIKGGAATEVVDHEDRLTDPLIKEDGEFREATWEEAYSYIVDERSVVTRQAVCGEHESGQSVSTMSQDHTELERTITRQVLRGSRQAGRGGPPLLRSGLADSREEGSGGNEDGTLEISIPDVLVDSTDTVRVLHVDDNPEYTELTKTFLERHSERFHVVAETSALEGMKRLREAEFDCIVADYEMPTTDGLEFLELVREEHPDLPFILFTGAGDEALASKAISAGVTDYVRKYGSPDQYDVLANRIDNAVERFRTQQQFWDALSLYQRLVEQDLTGVCVVQDGEFVYVNSYFADIVDREREALLGAHPREVVCDSEEQFGDMFDGQLAQFRRECELVQGDGSTTSVEVHGGPVQCGGEPGCIGVVWDQ